MGQPVRMFKLAADGDSWTVTEQYDKPSAVQIHHCSGEGVFSECLHALPEGAAPF